MPWNSASPPWLGRSKVTIQSTQRTYRTNMNRTYSHVPRWSLKTLQNGLGISWNHDFSIANDQNSAANVRCWWFFHWNFAKKFRFWSGDFDHFPRPDQKWWHRQRIANWLGSWNVQLFVWVYHLIWRYGKLIIKHIKHGGLTNHNGYHVS